jgi:hypothetical protein
VRHHDSGNIIGVHGGEDVAGQARHASAWVSNGRDDGHARKELYMIVWKQLLDAVHEI